MHITHRDQIEPLVADHGEIIRELAGPRHSPLTRHSLAEVILPPGKGSLPHYHPEVEEVYYLLQGEAEMEVDRQVERVGPGDVVVIPSKATHHIRNLSDKEVILLVTCAPAWTPGCEVKV
jgi:mannose-6-phosphate isomerase-like protein (cupin superfamily)